MEIATLLSLFLIGLSYGSSACLLTCMPVLSPLLLGSAAQERSFVPVLLPFSLGRLGSYMAMAVAAFVSAAWLKTALQESNASQYILGSATVAMAVYILFFSAKKGCAASKMHHIGGSSGYFMMGAGLSLSACAPVMTLIGVSMHATSALYALLMGAAFGLGAVGAMLIVYGVLLTPIAKETVMRFRTHHKVIEKSAGMVLLLVGCAVLLGWMHL